MKELHDNAVRIQDGITLKAVLNQAYDMTYGLFNYSGDSVHPFASVLLHPAEQLGHRSPRQDRLIRYHAAGVYRFTGLTFDQFLHRPPYQVEEMLTACEELGQKEYAAAANGLAAAGLNLNLNGQKK